MTPRRREVERALAVDPSLAAELGHLPASASGLAAAAPGLAPSPAVRDRLLASVDTRFERFVARMSELFDVAADRARELFRLIDRKDAWEPGPDPGLVAHPLPGRPGPGRRRHRVRAPGAGRALRLAPPRRRRAEPGPGRRRRRRAVRPRSARAHEAFAEAGTEHDFVNVGDEDFVFAVWVWGVDFSVPRPQ
jgi:hypothetical protein